MGAVITLTTDFGLDDAYVAALKGVILSINPGANLVDISHSIRPQDVSQAAFVLGTVYEFFPQRTIHVVVVDPGVGTDRRAIILRTPSADFIAPDNGVLSYVLQRSSAKPENATDTQVRLEPDLEAVAITRNQYWLSPVSATFHGRDIFAPVAAHLSLGLSPADFGEAITSLALLPLPRPYQAADGTLIGHILHIDNFGNLITDIKSSDLPPMEQEISIEIGDQIITGLSHTYGEGRGLLALIGSNDYLEVSLRDGTASIFLDAAVGNEIKIRLRSGSRR